MTKQDKVGKIARWEIEDKTTEKGNGKSIKNNRRREKEKGEDSKGKQ